MPSATDGATRPVGATARPFDPGPRDEVRRLGPALLVIALWLLLLPFTHHYGNPDGPAYAEVAARWASGEWSAAVNAYWGPLLSWAAVPLLWLGVPALLALRVVLLVGALLALPPLRRLAHRAGASVGATEAVLLGLAPFLVYNALFGLYPDVLMATALLYTVDLATHPSVLQRRGLAVAAGLCAGVAYLAKAYAIPVALVSLPLVVTLHRWTPSRPSARQLRRVVGLVLAGFAAVVVVWGTVLSVSYGGPTLTTSAGFNAQLVAPGSAGNPYNVRGLYEPPDGEVVSAWIEPSRLPVPLRTGATSLDDRPAGDERATDPGGLGHRVETAVANSRIVVGSLLRRGAPLVLLAGVAAVVAVRRRQLPPPALLGPAVAGAVAVGGLTLIIAIERYTWLAVLALAPAAAVGLDHLLRGRRRVLPTAAGVLVALLTLTSLHGLMPRFQAMREVSTVSAALAGTGILDGRVATLDRWQQTHLLCFEVGCQYLGRPESDDVDTVAVELAAAGVDHLVVWDGDEDEVAGLPTVDGPGQLTVHTVTPEGLRPTYRVGREPVPMPAG
jgi:hypothetical protein